MSEQTAIAGRMQQTIAAALIFCLGLTLAFVSFNVDEQRAYLFPQLISILMVGLAAYALMRALRGNNRTGANFSLDEIGVIAPALALMLLYVFVLAPVLGFYAGATLAFFSIYTLYDPRSHRRLDSWLIRLAVTAGFILVIYLVFAVGLRVQTPRGIFI